MVYLTNEQIHDIIERLATACFEIEEPPKKRGDFWYYKGKFCSNTEQKLLRALAKIGCERLLFSGLPPLYKAAYLGMKMVGKHDFVTECNLYRYYGVLIDAAERN